MAKMNINTEDNLFEKHAVYIFKALQNVRSCVVVDGAQLATEPGFPKASSVKMQISRIAARWGLNIKATTGATAGDPTVFRTPRTSATRARNSTPKKKMQQQLAIKWHEETDNDTETGAVEMPFRAKARKSPRAPKAKKRDRDFVYDDVAEDEEEEDADLKPSPSKKRFFHPVWTSEDEKDDGNEKGYVTAGNEPIKGTKSI